MSGTETKRIWMLYLQEASKILKKKILLSYYITKFLEEKIEEKELNEDLKFLQDMAMGEAAMLSMEYKATADFYFSDKKEFNEYIAEQPKIFGDEKIFGVDSDAEYNRIKNSIKQKINEGKEEKRIVKEILKEHIIFPFHAVLKENPSQENVSYLPLYSLSHAIYKVIHGKDYPKYSKEDSIR